MNYEQKYNDALDAARHIYDDMKSGGNFGGMEDLEVIFPELRESEDERIRKELYAVVNDLVLPDEQRARLNAWLEKQKALSELGKYIAAKRTKPGFMFAGNDSVSWEELPLDVRKHDYPYYFIGDLDCYPFDVEKQKELKPRAENGIPPLDFYQGIMAGRSDVIDHPEQFGLCKPAEWSDEDEKMVQFWNMYYEHKVGDWPNKDVVEHLERFREWINNRFKSLRPEPKGKWAKRLEEAQARWKPSEEQMAALAAAKMGVDTDYELLESLYEQLKALM